MENNQLAAQPQGGAVSNMSEQEAIAMLRAQSGEGVRKPGFPYLNFNGAGTAGNFYLWEKTEEGETTTDLGEGPLTVRMLMCRYRVNTFKSWNSFEFDSMDELVTLKDKTGAKIHGTYNDLKTKFKLTLERVLYVESENGKLAKLALNGYSLSNLFEYFKSFSHNDSVTLYKIVMTRRQMTNDKGTFYVLDFSRGEKLSALEVLAKQQEIKAGIDFLRSIKDNFGDGDTEIAPSTFSTAPQIAKADIAKDPDEAKEIKVEDIPF